MKLEDLLEATIVRKKVIKKGRQIVRKRCPEGYKLVGNRCERMKGAEKRARRKGAVRANRKGKALRRRSQRRSIRVRQARGL